MIIVAVLALLVLVALVVIGLISAIVHSIARTPRQAGVLWASVPPVLLAMWALAGLLLSVGGWMMSPSWAEVQGGIFFAALGAICGVIIVKLYRIGGFSDPLPEEPAAPSQVIVYYQNEEAPTRPPWAL